MIIDTQNSYIENCKINIPHGVGKLIDVVLFIKIEKKNLDMYLELKSNKNVLQEEFISNIELRSENVKIEGRIQLQNELVITLENETLELKAENQRLKEEIKKLKKSMK